jgi:nitroalkane oxidase
VRVLTDLMRVVGIESYDRALPLGRLQDALALPLFGGVIGVRRRRLHAILKQSGSDPLMTGGEAKV